MINKIKKLAALLCLPLCFTTLCACDELTITVKPTGSITDEPTEEIDTPVNGETNVGETSGNDQVGEDTSDANIGSDDEVGGDVGKPDDSDIKDDDNTSTVDADDGYEILPVDPVEPAPVLPEKPVEPEKPVKPVEPEEPNDPLLPIKPEVPEESGGSMIQVVYYITFDAGDAKFYAGSHEETSTLELISREGGILEEWPPVPCLPGERFVGWFTEKEGGMHVTQDCVFRSDIVLYAQFESVLPPQF